MYRREIRILVSLISTFVILSVYALYVYKNYVAGNFEIINDYKFWGSAVLVVIPVMIVAQIIIHIVFFIVHKIVTDEEVPTITDEMDRLIELKAIKISHWGHVLGFVAAMASQALGMQPYVLFVVLIVSCFASTVFEGGVKIYFYRKGI